MKTNIFTYVNQSPPSPDSHGPLEGKSFSVQPNMSLHGWPTDAGSVALKGFIAIEDATVVERLQKAAAVIVGSTRMSELGFGLNGDTAGAALSEGRVDMAFMTDTMGEARITASRIRAYGFKPTTGIVSRFGLIGLVPSMESFGLLAHKPDDIALVLGIIAGNDGRDFSMHEGEIPQFSEATGTDDSIKRIGIVRECMNNLTDEETVAFRSGMEKLTTMGFDIKELSFPDFDLFRTVHHIVGSVEASSSCGKYDGVRYGHRTASAKNWNDMYLKSRSECFGLTIKTYLFQGAYFQFENYAAFENASRIRARMLKETNGLFTVSDALAFPTRRKELHDSTAQNVDEIYDECELTLPANVLGLPSAQIPGFVCNGKTDFGLQIMGPRMSDARLLSLANRLSRSVEGV
jgi:aspartyl-tRNA(Asn)/glutamyl-tRNA(Gln) amidotransferase subunit A